MQKRKTEKDDTVEGVKMKEFKVNISKARAEIEEHNQIDKNLEDIAQKVLSVRNALTMNCSATVVLKQILRDMALEIKEEQTKVRLMSSCLSKAMETYEATEKRIAENVKNGGKEEEEDGVKVEFKSEAKIDLRDILKNSNNSKLKDLEKKISDFEKAHNRDLKSKKGYYEKDENGKYKWHDAGENGTEEDKKAYEKDQMKKAATIAGVDASVEKALWEKKVGDPDKTGAQVSVCKGQANAGAYIGLYGLDKDGNKVFRPGIGCEAGASFTLAEASAQATVGNKYLGGKVKGEVAAGKVGAEAGIDVGLYDKDGKFNPQVGASAKAEAIAAEASVAAGATVLGTDVTAKGGVNFGIGAHADVGLKDGKLSLDLGASVGVGVSVDLEIDFSGTVEAVADKAKSAWDAVTSWF